MPSITEEAGMKGEHGDAERDKDEANNHEAGGTDVDSGGNANGSGESIKRKSNEVTATPDRMTHKGNAMKGKGSERLDMRETKKKRGGIKDLFDKMNKQKEEMKNNRSATKSTEATPHADRDSGEGKKIESPPVILKTPTPSLFPKGSMKPSQIEKAKAQSEKVKQANEKFATVASGKEGPLREKGGG